MLGWPEAAFTDAEVAELVPQRLPACRPSDKGRAKGASARVRFFEWSGAPRARRGNQYGALTVATYLEAILPAGTNAAPVHTTRVIQRESRRASLCFVRRAAGVLHHSKGTCTKH